MGAAELLSMNAERWHRAKPFRKKLLRDDEGMNPDYATLCAWEAGYFHGYQERPEINELLDLIATDLASGSVYSEQDSDEIMRLALSEDCDMPENPMEHVAPKDFRVPVQLRPPPPPNQREIPANSTPVHGDDGLVVYLYRTEFYTAQQRYVNPWLAKLLGGTKTVSNVRYWAKAYPANGTAPAFHKFWDSEVARAWYCDEFLHPCPF
jgi:hypothetical protein